MLPDVPLGTSMITDRDEPAGPSIINLLRESLASPTPVPAYHRLEMTLRDLIERGVVTRGEQLPPEQRMAEDLHISRPTVRHALQRLEQADLVRRERGTGTFISS